MEHKQEFDSWALVEIMGHQRIAGHVTEQEIGGAKFVRVDVPADGDEQPLTKFLGASSIYAITPVTEETARSLAKAISATPISIWDARRLVSAADEKKKLQAPEIDADLEEHESYSDLEHCQPAELP